MSENSSPGEDGLQLGTLAEKLTWLMRHAHPAGRGPLTTHQAAALVEQVTGEPISHTTIWKITQGINVNPGMRVIQALAKTFAVPVSYFFGEPGEEENDQIQEQAELLAMIRDADIDTEQLRLILGAPPGVRQAIVDLFRQAAQAEADRA